MTTNIDALKSRIKVLMCDQYGTVVDMQAGLIEVATPYLKSKGWNGRPDAFVTWWRRTYFETGSHFGSPVLRAVASIACVLAFTAVHAEPTPVGRWRTVDDATGKVKAVVNIVENGGVLSGRIEQIFDADPAWNGRCLSCRDERKDQPVLGMVILSNLRKDGAEFTGGKILDPENGNVYRCKLRVTADGQKLEVRGFIGISLFGRTQVWVRER